MTTLAIDTTGTHCSVAILKDTVNVHEISENIGRGHAERLAPMVQELFTLANITAPNIKRIGVCTGPGSFTGLRVGLAFAKSFALPRKLPVIGISALEVLASQSEGDVILSVMDVRRGDVCWARYGPNGTLNAPVTQALEDAKQDIQSLTFDTVVGDGAHLVSTPSDHVRPSGIVLAKLAQMYSPDTHPATPLYSRGPDAKLPGGVTLA